MPREVRERIVLKLKDGVHAKGSFSCALGHGQSRSSVLNPERSDHSLCLGAPRDAIAWNWFVGFSPGRR